MQYLIFITAFLIRLIYIIQIKATVFHSNFILDEAFYNTWARSIASGNWIPDKVFNALPLYPYILGIIYKIFGYSPFAGRLFQAGINSFSCLLIYIVAKRLFCNRRAGIIAGFIACFYGPFIFYSGVFTPTTFVIFSYLLTSLTFFRARKRPHPVRFLIFGIVAGFAALFRASILLFVPFVLLWFLITSIDKKKALLGIGAAAIGLICVIAPVTINNYIASKDLVFLTSHAGVNFYIGNNEDADGLFKAPSWARSNIDGLAQDSKTIAERSLSRELKPSDVSAHYKNKAFSFIKENPLKFSKLLAKKLLLFVNRQEIYDVAYYQVRREHASILKFPFIMFIVVGSLGLCGVIVSVLSKEKIAPFYIFIITYTITIILYFITSRYRVPFATAMIVFSGFLIARILQCLSVRNFKRLALIIIFLVLTFSLVNVNLAIDVESTGYNNLGNLYVSINDYDNAISSFKKAIELNEDDPKPYNDIAYSYLMQNDPDNARGYIKTSLLKDPDYPFAHINLGLLYEFSGNLDYAEAEYNRAIALNPNIPEAYNNLGKIYEKNGKRALAVNAFKKAISLNPNNPRTYYNLAVIYGRANELDKAKAYFKKSLEADPDFTPAEKALEYFK